MDPKVHWDQLLRLRLPLWVLMVQKDRLVRRAL